MDGSLRWIDQLARPAPQPTKEAVDRAKLITQIEELAADGRSADEIAKLLGENPRRIVRLARQAKIQMAGRGGRRHLTVDIAGTDLSLVNILAKEAQVTRGEMIVRLALASLKDGVASARDQLGKGARPKRKYRPRQP
jgi:hypothetical protein